MIVDEKRILDLIKRGEGISLEFKSSCRQINRDVYETICAFLNRNGGTLLLGVRDSGEIVGVEAEAVEGIKKDFVNTVNNPQKLNPPAYLSIDEVSLQGKTLLHVYVPESSQVHRCNGRIYDRNEDGDLDITDQTPQVARLYQRKQSTYTENTVYPHIGLQDLRKDLIERCRKMAAAWTAGHPWSQMDDAELVQSAQLMQTDPQTLQRGVTLAGVLLLGGDNLILSTLPHHRTDLILRKVNLDRYDDRDLVRTNLIDSYDRIIAFVQKNLPDPFYLEGVERISVRDTIFREVASNILIHREYTSAFPAKLIIEYGRVRTENASRAHGFGLLDPSSFSPYPKNPVIGAFFREIHRADELGSGMRRMLRYGKTYGGADPEMIEGDIFRIVVSVPEFSGIAHREFYSEAAGTQSAPSRHPVGIQSAPSQDQSKILVYCLEERSFSELLMLLGRKDRTKFRRQVLTPMLDARWLERTIPDKPTSRQQKYRLTEAGKELLKNLENGQGTEA